MSTDNCLVYGTPILLPMPVDSSSADISKGDFVSLATAGYIQQASAGELPVGIAQDSVTSPSADGDVTILVDVSCETVYRFDPDAGTSPRLSWAPRWMWAALSRSTSTPPPTTVFSVSASMSTTTSCW